jgi:hypothetical protein
MCGFMHGGACELCRGLQGPAARVRLCFWAPTCYIPAGVQVHNALGYAYFNMGKTDIAIGEYKQAVEKQPG